jgi:hypothetical protein
VATGYGAEATADVGCVHDDAGVQKRERGGNVVVSKRLNMLATTFTASCDILREYLAPAPRCRSARSVPTPIALAYCIAIHAGVGNQLTETSETCAMDEAQASSGQRTASRISAEFVEGSSATPAQAGALTDPQRRRARGDFLSRNQCTGSGKSRRGWPAGTLCLGTGVCPRSGVLGGKLSVIACNSWPF